MAPPAPAIPAARNVWRTKGASQRKRRQPPCRHDVCERWARYEDTTVISSPAIPVHRKVNNEPLPYEFKELGVRELTNHHTNQHTNHITNQLTQGKITGSSGVFLDYSRVIFFSGYFLFVIGIADKARFCPRTEA